jgi:hypothetical protein
MFYFRCFNRYEGAQRHVEASDLTLLNQAAFDAGATILTGIQEKWSRVRCLNSSLSGHALANFTTTKQVWSICSRMSLKEE